MMMEEINSVQVACTFALPALVLPLASPAMQQQETTQISPHVPALPDFMIMELAVVVSLASLLVSLAQTL